MADTLAVNLLPITLLFAALNSLLFLFLSIRVVRLRFKEQVSIGSGGHPRLEVATRVHGNFAEYVPLALILMALLEANSASQTVLYILGAVLTVGRVSHAYGLTKTLETNPFRAGGMMATWGVIGFSALYGLYRVLA